MALSLPGFGLAILAWGPARVVGLAVTLAVPVTLVIVILEHQHPREGTAPLGEVLARVARTVMGAMIVGVSIAAVAGLLPGLGMLLALLAGVTTPPAVDACRRMLEKVAPSPTFHLDGAGLITPPRPHPEPAAIVRKLTDSELCSAWSQSFWALRETHDPVAKMMLVCHRQHLLDELENRNASALEAWLASGAARPSGSPVRFLRDGGDDQPAAA